MLASFWAWLLSVDWVIVAMFVTLTFSSVVLAAISWAIVYRALRRPTVLSIRFPDKIRTNEPDRFTIRLRNHLGKDVVELRLSHAALVQLGYHLGALADRDYDLSWNRRPGVPEPHPIHTKELK